MATLLFRAICLYLLLYFLFISDFVTNYRILWHVDPPLKSISNSLARIINRIFFSPEFREWQFFDSYWTYSKLIFFLLISLLTAFIWTSADKGRRSGKLFIYMHAFSRYYLAIAILLYAMWKIFEVQFYLEPKNFLLPMAYNSPRALFWTFLASSRSYGIFGGILEAIAGFLLLFRRTATIGALITLGTLSNILVLDIAYDTPIKVIVFHLMLFDILILWPDLIRVFRFFILGKTETLRPAPSIVSEKKWVIPGYILKTVIISVTILPMIKTNLDGHYKLYHPSFEAIVGVHVIDSAFGAASTGIPHGNLNPKSWSKFAVQADSTFHALTPDDSVTVYSFNSDTAVRRLKLTSADSAVTGAFYYRNLDKDHWLFEGHYGGDSVRFVTRLVDLRKLPLLKGNGRIIWSWKNLP